jgi:hypothetical protein
MSEADTPAPEPEDVEPEEVGSGTPRRSRLRRPTVFEAGAFVALVGAIVGLVFTFAPGCEPQPPSNVSKATISNIRVTRHVTFKRYLLRQFKEIPPGLTEKYLASRGAVVDFDWEIIGLRDKHLPFGWELSDSNTNDLVAADMIPWELTPSKNEDSGSWAIWIRAPKPGRRYYATVTIYKPEGPPYELKHFPTPVFPGFAST